MRYSSGIGVSSGCILFPNILDVFVFTALMMFVSTNNLASVFPNSTDSVMYM